MTYDKKKSTLTNHEALVLHNTMFQLTMGGKDLPHEIDSLLGMNIYELKPLTKDRDAKRNILIENAKKDSSVASEEALKALDKEKVKVELYTMKKAEWDSFIARVNKKEDREVRIPGGLEMELYGTIIIL